MDTSSRHLSIMSSISALKGLYLSKQKESRVLISILLSFVFLFSSLKINIYADYPNSTYQQLAYDFCASMGFTVPANGAYYGMNNTNTGSVKGQNSDILHVYYGYDIYFVYYYISGQQFPEISNNTVTISRSNSLVNYDLYYCRFYVNSSNSGGTFSLKFSSSAEIDPVYIGTMGGMPDDVLSLIDGTNNNTLLQSINTNTVSLNNGVNNLYSRLGDTNSLINDVQSKISTTNTKLDTVNSNLTDIKSYFESNTTTTNNNVSANNTMKSTFDTNANTLATFESDQAQNLDTNLQALNISSSDGLLINSNFVNSAVWVRNMFDRLIIDSPFELVLIFCLSIGIAFAMIGKVK